MHKTSWLITAVLLAWLHGLPVKASEPSDAKFYMLPQPAAMKDIISRNGLPFVIVEEITPDSPKRYRGLFNSAQFNEGIYFKKGVEYITIFFDTEYNGLFFLPGDYTESYIPQSLTAEPLASPLPE